jgi:hypothetical protein
MSASRSSMVFVKVAIGYAMNAGAPASRPAMARRKITAPPVKTLMQPHSISVLGLPSNKARRANSISVRQRKFRAATGARTSRRARSNRRQTFFDV